MGVGADDQASKAGALPLLTADGLLLQQRRQFTITAQEIIGYDPKTP